MQNVRRALALICLLCGSFLYAQEGEEAPIESDWSGYLPSLYSRGDQFITISLGLGIPLFYADSYRGITDSNMTLGGVGVLGYGYFLNSNFFWGIELSGAFFSTTGKNNYFIVPIGAKGGWQFIAGRFEFPLSLLVGFAPQQHLDNSYFGFFSKAAASVFFRYSPEWSFGLNSAFWWVPQWTGKVREGHSGVNIHGFFLEITAGVRYHF